ncbi:hypothetical protein [Candidatus Clostridium radicumherbarum]|uniref:Uncharacterized protein n=1 Tax=Candidatus Clostridium radicumherbarum TaxID=3381662 RepID=A0ABW8TXP1_9CLOT
MSIKSFSELTEINKIKLMRSYRKARKDMQRQIKQLDGKNIFKV